MPGTYGIHNNLIKVALKDGSLSRVRFDEAVRRNVELIHKATTAVSSTDDEDENENELPEPDVLAKENHELAYTAALDCVVLLKNDNNILPLNSQQFSKSSGNATIALIGDFCQDSRFQGMGSSEVNAVSVEAMLDHIADRADNYLFSRGYKNDDVEDEAEHNSDASRLEITREREKLIDHAVEVAKKADVVVLHAGVPEIFESEGFDRSDLNLPAQHNLLIERICEVNSNVIVILSNGGPVLLPPWKEKVKAILAGHLLGQASGRALVDILFGVVSPSGKLAESWPLIAEDIPSDKYFPGNSHTVEYREGLNVGYRYYDTAKIPVLFPFGYGLSYSTFTYTDCECNVLKDTSLADDDTIVRVQCRVNNIGKVSGAEIVQLFIHNDNSACDRAVYHPEHQLQDFYKTKILNPGESEVVTLDIKARAFSFYDVGISDWILEEGSRYEIRLSASSREIRWTYMIDGSDICQLENCQLRTATPSVEAFESHPSLHTRNTATYTEESLSAPLEISDDQFRSMLGRDPSEYLALSTMSLLGENTIDQSLTASLRSLSTTPSMQNEEQQQPLLLPNNISLFHRNSLLEEIENSGCFASLFSKIVVKAMERELEDPNDKRQRKMIHEVAKNLPLRCLAIFSRGGMSFDVLDSLIAMFNGRYCSAVGHLSTGARNSSASFCGLR